jgi:hypothetical protein
VSARRKANAKFTIKDKTHVVSKQSALVSIESDAVLATKDRGAVVVTVRNKADRALARLPIAITILDTKGKKLFGNDVPGLQPSLIEVPLIQPGKSISWVNDQLNIAGTKPGKLKAVVGDPKTRPVTVPEIVLSKAKLLNDVVSGVEAQGTVTNKSKVAQVNLVVYGVARRAGKVVAAGRAIVPKLKPGATARFAMFWVGDPRHSRLELSAPPTVLG